MPGDRISSRKQIEKLVAFFSDNIYQFKASTFNETQARQQLIDPLFEALGWDVHNRLMLPLFRQEVVPESRVKGNAGKEEKDQESLFLTKETLGKYHKEYSSILDYIAEDEYKASSKEAVKKPDYRFRIGGQTKFFVEAKKPHVDLAKNQSAIFQVKRYGFSGRVPIAVLTDFEEFRVFDCTQRPSFEKYKLGIIKDFDLTYKQYLDRFDRLFDMFSRDAVAGGSLESLTKKMMLKRTGDFALDREFLEDLSKWREALARDIAGHPKNRKFLNDHTLNEAVQRILDRIIFIRVCEDREIEVENTLLAILRMWKERPGLSLYFLLNELFKKRRDLYNGLLFSPHQCEELEVGNDVLIKILENLNYPFSPYHFNEIGVEILGSIYEKFLGKTIHLTAKTTRIEDKPEVRKAGGVYYTPQYIVKYIVDNTLGKLLYEETVAANKPADATETVAVPIEIGIGRGLQDADVNDVGYRDNRGTVAAVADRGFHDAEATGLGYSTGRGQEENARSLKLSPKQVAKLKIIDIACGSGSFLLGAFQKLIDYHIEWYTVHPEDIKSDKNVPDAYKDADGNYHLSPRKKRDILVNNIYGVDIDRQAVEVTQMSLYLKVLEGENAETLNPQMTLALKEVYLPSLAKNIKCGNSLIGTDFTSQGEMFDDEVRRKVNPFDWELEFPEILTPKSFPNASIGNLTADKEDSRLKSAGMTDKRGGFDVVIGNPPYLYSASKEYAEYFQARYKLSQYQTDFYVFFIEKALSLVKHGGWFSYIVSDSWLNSEYFSKIRIHLLKEHRLERVTVFDYPVFDGVALENSVFVVEASKKPTEILIHRFFNQDKSKITNRLEPLEVIERGIIDPHQSSLCLNLQKKIEGGSVNLKKIVRINRGIHAYRTDGYGKSKYGKGSQTTKDREEQSYHSNKPKNKTYLPELKGKDVFRFVYVPTGKYLSYGSWLAEPRERDYFYNPKVVARKILSAKLHATYIEEPYALDQSLYILISCDRTKVSLKYVLSILASNIGAWYLRTKYSIYDALYPWFTVKQLETFPIRTIDFTNPSEKKMHDDLVKLVEKMLELNKQLQKVHFDSEKEPIQRQINATDKKIDDLVYKLYDLTEEEIKIVEGKL